MVLVVDPNPQQIRSIKGLQSAFALTAAEARVAGLVASGLSAPQVAKALGVAPTTVKTHLGHTFEKTGAHSQAALARLLAAFPALD